MTKDEHLIPVPSGRGMNTTLAEITQARAYEKYGKYGAPSENHFRDYLFVVLKRKWLILSLILVVTSLVTIQMFRLPSIYEGDTVIRIEPKTQSVLRNKELVISQADPNFWGTQLKLLENPILAREVVLTLDLMHNPTFMNPQNEPGFFSSLRRVFSRDKTSAKAQKEAADQVLISQSRIREEDLSAEELAQLESYEDAIIGSETAEPEAGTNLVHIRFRHSDPQMALKVSNTLAEVFINNNLARMTAGSTKAQDILAKEIADLQGKIIHGQEAQFNYAKSHNLPMTTDTSQNVEWQRFLQLGAQLVEAEKDTKLAHGIYEHAKNSSDPLSVPEVLKATEVTNFRRELASLRQKKDSLLITYTPEWPEVKKVDAEIKRIEGELKIAVAQEVDGLRVRYESLQTHENEIRASFAAQRGVTTQQAGDQLEIMQQGQEIETNKQYLNTLLQRQRELEAISGERTNELSIENPGRLPRVPVAPARVRNIVIAFLLSLVAGIGLAFLLDFLDDTVKSIDDVDRYLHLPALALIPAGRNEAPRLKGVTPATSPAASTALALVEDVRSPVAESYRHLRTSLLLSSAGQPPKTILITSSQPSEGKTTTAINTAVMLAKTGAAVVIVDCDLRRPRLHAHFDLPNSRGLTNWLSGETDLDSLILSYDKQPNLRLLTSGPVPPNPAELLGSEEMRKLLTQLSEKFAHIIIDSPPAISFTDASILATMVDGVVLVVHGGHSSRAVVRRAKQQLLDVGANIFGIVLNNVKVEAYDHYSNYYSAYYASDYYDSEATGADAPQTG